MILLTFSQFFELLCQSNFHAASKPAKTKFNKFTPPPKKWPFWGVVSFLEYFHEFLGLEHKKKLDRLWAKPMFWDNYRPIPATSGYFVTLGNKKKCGIFSIFGQIWQLFFFKIRLWAKLVLEPLKMVFLTFFRS